jgi:hypothetical protein
LPGFGASSSLPAADIGTVTERLAAHHDALGLDTL